MRKGSTGTGKKESCAAVIIAAIVLMGCSQAATGDSPDFNKVPAGEQSYVSFFDGDVIKGSEVRVTGGVPVWEMGTKQDISRIPADDVCTVMCYRIQMSDEDVRPIQAVAEDGSTLEYVGKKYDGAGYPLGGGWYGFLIPNGLEKYAIRAGDSLFMVQEDN